MRWLALLLFACAQLASADEADAVCRHAVQLHQSGEFAAAVPEYASCLSLRPDSSELRSNYGAALAHLGQYDQAIVQYERALGSAASDLRLRFNLTLAYYKSGRIARTVEELKTLHERSPDTAQFTLLLADCYLRLGEPQNVIDILQPLSAQFEDDLGYSYVLGMALIQKGELEKGQAVVDRILRNEDSAEAHFFIGSVAYAKNDFPKAVSEFRKTVELNPTLEGAQSFYGQSLLATGDADGALAAFRKELTGDANDYEANVKLGSILSVRKQYTESLPFLEHAAMVRPESLEPRQELYRIYDHLGRTADAARERAAIEKAGASVQVEDSSGLLAAGSQAPEFNLPAHGSDRLLRLAELHRNRPVVLVFGSYTCPKFRFDAAALNDMYRRYRDRVGFVLVYVQEAHSDAEWKSSINEREGVSLAPAKSIQQKREYASACVRKMKIEYPVAVDDMDRKVEAAYAAWPSAVYVIGADGRIHWRSRLGELDFSAADMDGALQRALAMPSRRNQ